MVDIKNPSNNYGRINVFLKPDTAVMSYSQINGHLFIIMVRNAS